MNKKVILYLLIILVLLTGFNFVLAGDYYKSSVSLVPCGAKGNMCNLCYFAEMAQNIFEFLIKISLASAILFATIAGILLITSSGSQTLLSTAKLAIGWSLRGFVFCLFSWIIVNSIAGMLGYKESWSTFTLTCTNPVIATPAATPSNDCAKCSGLSRENCVKDGNEKFCKVSDGKCAPDGEKCNNCQNCSLFSQADCPKGDKSSCEVKDSKCQENKDKCKGCSGIAAQVEALRPQIWYVYGGSGNACQPGKICTDCSGFTQMVWQRAGVGNPGRTTESQASGSTETSCNNLKEGDLVIKRSGASLSGRHVGVYVGNNTIVHNSGKSANPSPVKNATVSQFCTNVIGIKRCKPK